MTPGSVRVARVLHGTTAEGPGLRTVVWFQGCSIQCEGCINPHLFSRSGGSLVSIESIVAEAVSAGVEGITLIGGEPFDQAAAGAALARRARLSGLGIIAFSGYEFESLMGRGPDTEAFLAETDLLVDGPYQEQNPEPGRALVGSTNQRFIHLTDRYKDYRPEQTANRLDVRVLADGTIDVAGFLDGQGLDEFAASIGTQRKPRRHVKG